MEYPEYPNNVRVQCTAFAFAPACVLWVLANKIEIWCNNSGDLIKTFRHTDHSLSLKCLSRVVSVFRIVSKQTISATAYLHLIWSKRRWCYYWPPWRKPLSSCVGKKSTTTKNMKLRHVGGPIKTLTSPKHFLKQARESMKLKNAQMGCEITSQKIHNYHHRFVPDRMHSKVSLY